MASIVVVGAGVMGSDVALDCACAGHRVALHDTSAAALAAAEDALPAKLRRYKLMAPRLKSCDPIEVAGRIRYAADWQNADVAAADWVIENVSEDWQTKQSVYRQLRELCREDTRFAANTSCISITKIAALMPRSEQVIGMHLMNPVPLKPVAEVVRGWHTSDDTVLAAKALLKSLNKNAIVVNDSPGFVSNRLSHLFMNEAAFLVQDGVAEPADIDAVFKQGYGHKMGPLETADLIGIDTVVDSLSVLYQSYQDPKFRCCPLLQKMADAGETGCKSGKGFYTYRA